MYSLTAHLIVLSAFIYYAKAELVDCDPDGRFCRDVLPFGARVGIGLGIAAAVIALFTCAGLARRRRTQRRNLAYITNPNQGQYYPQSHQPQSGYGNQHQGNYQPEYQPGYDASAYPPNQGNGGPPGYSYAPPPGAPPPKK